MSSTRRSPRIATKNSVIYTDVVPFSDAEVQALIKPCKELLNQIEDTEGAENRVPLIHRIFHVSMSFPDQVAFFAKFRTTALAALDRLILECSHSSDSRKHRAGLRSLRRDFQLFVRGLKDLPTWQADVPPVVLLAPHRRATIMT